MASWAGVGRSETESWQGRSDMQIKQPQPPHEVIATTALVASQQQGTRDDLHTGPQEQVATFISHISITTVLSAQSKTSSWRKPPHPSTFSWRPSPALDYRALSHYPPRPRLRSAMYTAASQTDCLLKMSDSSSQQSPISNSLHPTMRQLLPFSATPPTLFSHFDSLADYVVAKEALGPSSEPQAVA